MKIISSFALLVVSTIALAESTWSVAIETEEDWHYYLRDCAVLSNGNAVVSITGPFEDPFLICFDREGEILWSRHILEAESSRAFESLGGLVTLDDGFAVCVHSEPRATGIDTDVAVVRMDSSGSILWTFVLGEDDEDIWMSTDMIPCSDGGLLVAGCPGQQLLGGYVFKLSADGRLEWMTQPEDIEGFALSVLQTVDGDYCVLVSNYNSIDVQHITSDGLVSAPITVADSEIPIRARISRINDSFWIFPAIEGHVLCGERLYPDNGMQNEIIVQLPSDCEVQLADILDGDLLISGGTDGLDDALLLLYNFNGDLLWQRCYDTGADDYLFKAILSNHGILAMGNINSISGEVLSFWILKTDISGIVEGAGITENGILLIEPEVMYIDLYDR
ncbi:MAG: hypothetical protein KAR44_10670 [Candidatus Aegiribacteria sp.]|nr:hypothetical protein [Candidatus Aegiribacteria sp.]